MGSRTDESSPGGFNGLITRPVSLPDGDCGDDGGSGDPSAAGGVPGGGAAGPLPFSAMFRRAFCLASSAATSRSLPSRKC